MLPLPQVKGKYAVGCTTLVCNPITLTIGEAKVRSEKGELVDLLRLDEVVYTVYYPADTANLDQRAASKGVPWLQRPVHESLSGFAKISGFARWLLWPVIHLYGRLIKISVLNNAPLLRPSNSDNEKDTHQWPLVIFSHGLSGSRTAYSSLCTRIAASGRIVLALEHHDGTAVAFHTDKKTQVYVKAYEVSGVTEAQFRIDQLEFRRHEAYIAYQSFRKLVQTNGTSEPVGPLDLRTQDNAHLDWATFSGQNTVKCDSDVNLVGHSFGGATVLSLLSNKAPSSYARIPVSKALVLDPWLEPFPAPGPTPYSQYNNESVDTLLDAEEPLSSQNSSSTNIASVSSNEKLPSPRVLVINSEAFTLWDVHFKRLVEVMSLWDKAKPLTIVRSIHMSFSDFKILPLIRNKASETIMDVIGKLSLGFLDGRIEEVLETCSVRKLEIETTPGKTKDGRDKRQIVGNLGDVAVL